MDDSFFSVVLGHVHDGASQWNEWPVFKEIRLDMPEIGLTKISCSAFLDKFL